EKSVPDIDEDTITISVQAAKNALARAGINPTSIGAVYVGSESHPYVVKPSATVVAEAIGTGPHISALDTEFACRAGSSNIFLCMGLVRGEYIDYGLAIGADTSQGMPGDALEYSAAAGGAAFIIGRKDVAAHIEGHHSYATDTTDFWRRHGEEYPSHGARFTGKPACFKHVGEAVKGLLSKLGLGIDDFDKVVFHMPNGKFPLAMARELGIPPEKVKDGLVVTKMGNCYSGSSLVGLCRVLDTAEPGERILMASYGSGAGSDAFSIKTNGRLTQIRDKAPKTDDYINRKEYLDYGLYVKMRGKLKT
ncbi:MAG: hydroxymethylglutaryl-CoA synthase, partial [Candidatus Aenigmatarchaeota archaeon]